MSGSWSDGYFTNSTYTYGYYHEMSPAHLRFCMLLKKMTPPPAEGFHYCELAMGQGLSANIHAVANHGSFIGTDFNPDHASFAADLAGRAGNKLQVRDASFEEFLQQEHPQYDYIVMHGTWSWVSTENRARVVEFVRRNLKPGGLFYMSYNCYPGWAFYQPLRELFALFDCHSGQGHNADARVKNAMARTEELLAAKPRFGAMPGIMERFTDIKNGPADYLAHEYLNADWELMYFREVAEQLAEAKLRFGASAVAFQNIPGFGLTEEAVAYLDTLHDPILQQQAYDFFGNTQFRKDIFIKGGTSLHGARHREAVLDQRFALVGHPSSFKNSIQCCMGSVDLDEDSHRKVLDILAEAEYSPKDLRFICERWGESADLSFLLTLLIHMVGQGLVHPCQTLEAARQCREACRAFNMTVLDEARSGQRLQFLASPETGSGVHVGRLDMIFLQGVLLGIDPQEHLYSVLRANNDLFTENGEAVTTESRTRELIQTNYQGFQTNAYPAMKGLGII